MAPETAAGRAHGISTASDVWALGVILWEMLCGQRPFTGAGGLETMRRIVEEEPVRPSSSVRLDGDLMTLAQRCLEKSPSRRPVSAGEVADELDRWLRGEPLRARRITPNEALWKWVRRKPVLAALYAALAVGTVTGFALWRRAENAVISLTATNDQLNEALRVSTATKLAGDARLQVEEEPTRALLLAVAAVEMTEKTGVGILPEAASALTSVLQKVGGYDASALGVQEAYDDALLAERLAGRNLPADQPGRPSTALAEYGRPRDAEGARAAIFDVSKGGAAATHRWQLWPKARPEPRDVRWLNDSRHLRRLMTPVRSSSGMPPHHPQERLPRRGRCWDRSRGRDGSSGLAGVGSRDLPRSDERSGRVAIRGRPSEEMVACLDFPTPDRWSWGRWHVAPVEPRAKYHFRLSPDGRWLFVTGDEKPQPVRVFALLRRGRPNFRRSANHGSPRHLLQPRRCA